MANMLETMKKQVEQTGNNLNKIFYVKSGSKRSVRVLAELDEAIAVPWHEKWGGSQGDGINTPCRELFGEECPYCDDPEVKNLKKFALPVYDDETNSVQIMCEKYSPQYSPLPVLMGFYETYGTITDRNYVIKVDGEALNKNVSAIPMEINPFKVSPKLKAEINKHSGEKQILEILKKAFPIKSETMPMKKKETPKEEFVVETEGPQQSFDIPDDEPLVTTENSVVDYNTMGEVELFKLCKERNIQVETRQPKNYYIDKLMAYDTDVWGDMGEEDDDPWNAVSF